MIPDKNLRRYTPPQNSREMRKQARYENSVQWDDVFYRNLAMLCSSFKWTGLPESVDSYFFEKTLLCRGSACIVDDKELGIKLGLPCNPASPMNLYYEHTVYNAVSMGFTKPFVAITHYNKDVFMKPAFNNNALVPEDLAIGCVCFDNTEQYPMLYTLEMYTTKIVDTMRAIDVVQKLMKTPRVIETDENSVATVQRAIQSVDENILAIFGRKDVAKALRESQSLDTGANPAILDCLWAHYNNLYSSFYTAFGINNLNTNDKKERLLVDEVNSNNESISFNIQHRLEQRQHFCENYKAAFGETISVELNYIQDDNSEEVEKDDRNDANTKRPSEDS